MEYDENNHEHTNSGGTATLSPMRTRPNDVPRFGPWLSKSIIYN